MFPARAEDHLFANGLEPRSEGRNERFRTGSARGLRRERLNHGEHVADAVLKLAVLNARRLASTDSVADWILLAIHEAEPE